MGYKVIGIDTSENMIEYAKKYVKNAKFYVMNAKKLVFVDNYFDGIWANMVFYIFQKKIFIQLYLKHIG